MSPGLKYALGRVGLFVVCAVPAVLLLPDTMNFFLKLMIALVVSAALSLGLLRSWRNEVADQMSANSRRRTQQKDKLRSALAGDEPAPGATPGTADHS